MKRSCQKQQQQQKQQNMKMISLRIDSQFTEIEETNM